MARFRARLTASLSLVQTAPCPLALQRLPSSPFPILKPQRKPKCRQWPANTCKVALQTK